MRPPCLLESLRALGAQFDETSNPATVLHFGNATAEATKSFEQGGVRDQSAHGRLRVRGVDRQSFLNGQCTQDLKGLSDERAALAALTTVKGRVIDLARIVQHGDSLLVLTSPGQATSIRETMSAKVVMEDCVWEDAAQDWASLQIFGPSARAAMTEVFGGAPAEFQDGPGAAQLMWGADSVVAFGTRAPGSGYEILIPPSRAGQAFDALVAAGLTPVGEQAYEQLRVEAGIQVLEREMGEHTNPLEAGLDFALSFNKGCYVGQEVVARLHSRGKVKRKLVGLRFPLDADPADLDEVFWDLLRVGNVCSAVRSPRLGATLALALLKSDYIKPGTPVYSVKESEKIEGEVSELPFA